MANRSNSQNRAPKLDSSPNSKPSNSPFQLASSTRHLSFLVDALKASVFSSSHHHHILEPPACPPPTGSVNVLYSPATNAHSCLLMNVTLHIRPLCTSADANTQGDASCLRTTNGSAQQMGGGPSEAGNSRADSVTRRLG